MRNIHLIQFLILIRKLGLRNVLRNLNYRISKKYKFSKLRRIKHESPVGPFFSDLKNFEGSINLYNNSWENKQTYFSWYIKNTSSIPNWNELCIAGVPFGDQKKDWHQIEINKSDRDIKEVWEASRMDWLITFSQKIYLGDITYVEKINEWLSDWISSNPAYKGPNWTCSQEASIRIINFCLASNILKKDYELNNGSIDFINMHLKRILPSLQYSISQQNNHATTEAAALFIGGLFLKNNGIEGSDVYLKTGRKVLEERVSSLISSCGVFSQYSTNYQRMLIDTLSMCEYWRIHFNENKFSEKFYIQSKLCLNWLTNLVDSENGDVPNLGANDGSLLIPLIGKDFYRDYRLSVELASKIFLDKSVYDNDDCFLSLFSWLGLEISQDKHPIKKNQNTIGGGFLMTRSQSLLAIFRYPDFKFRPSQEDIFHLDLWIDGKNILRDGGTFTYLRNSDNEYFSSASAHNTIQFDDHKQMPRLGKFLYGNWPNVIEKKFNTLEGSSINFLASYRDSGSNFHERSLTFNDKSITVVDRFEDSFSLGKLRWRLEPGDWTLSDNSIYKNNIRIEISENNDLEEIAIKQGWESRFYKYKSEVPVLEISFKDTTSIKTQISW